MSRFLNCLQAMAAAVLLAACAHHDRLAEEVCSPDSSITAMPLRLRLQDSYYTTPWMLVSSNDRPAGMGVIPEDGLVVGEGKADPDGWLALSPAQERVLRQAYCTRRPLWLLYPGQSIKIELYSGKPRSPQCTGKTKVSHYLFCIGYDISDKEPAGSAE
jgi:hypothetical protein